MNIEQARFNMIEQQIRPWEVLDPEVLRILSVVRREDFVPEAHRALAFVDMELPYGDVARGQVMLAPRVEARLLQELAVQGGETVLEIGTGTGHMAALLAQRAASVLSLETEPEFVSLARRNLARAGVSNVDVRHANGSREADVRGEFDVIVLSGSVADVPQALLQRLKPGGRLGAIVGDEPVMRATFVTRAAEGGLATRQPWDTVAPRLHGFAEHPRFVF